MEVVEAGTMDVAEVGTMELVPDAGAAAFVLVGGGGDGEKKGQADAEKEQVGTRFGCFVRCVDVGHGDREVLRPIGGSSGWKPGRSRSG